jgi:hypothetical protein
MLHRRIIRAFAFASILAAAAACTGDPTAPKDDTTAPTVPCTEPPPAQGMVCTAGAHGDFWSW